MNIKQQKMKEQLIDKYEQSILDETSLMVQSYDIFLEEEIQSIKEIEKREKLKNRLQYLN